MNRYYFIGIGGIGMSAIARYFAARGAEVAGYDLTPSPLTLTLESEGIPIHYTDDVEMIPSGFKESETIVIYTPAVPKDHSELQYFIRQGNRVVKRAEILGEITRLSQGLCIAGTHGKTTTSTLLAHLLYSSHVGCSAFLGGVSGNYKSNLLLSEHSPLVVIEADEFDRSFHHLSPHIAIITSADPDHLDIYGTPEAYRESFEHFTSLIEEHGTLLLHESAKITPHLREGVRLYRYSTEGQADFWASGIRIENSRLFFRWHYPAVLDRPGGSLEVELGEPLRINVDNAVAAMAAAYLEGATLEELRDSLASFRGVHRRFDKVIETSRHTLIDDYAHHPVELEAAIRSVRRLYPDKRIMGIFQPHLYSRTNDFYEAFAHSLSQLDEVILLDIYPARELPIPGVTSQMIAEHMTCPVVVVCKDKLLGLLEARQDLPEIVLMVGAGDIDRLVSPVGTLLETRI